MINKNDNEIAAERRQEFIFHVVSAIMITFFISWVQG